MSANHVLLQRIELSSSSSTIVFNNIPQGYTDLKVNVSARATSANTGYERLALYVAPNGSLSNLTSKLLLSANPPSSTSYTTGVVGWIPASDAVAATFSFVEMLFTNYSGTTTKPYMIDCISENSTTDFNRYTQSVFSGSCSSTAPITSLKFTVDGSSFAAGSTFSIYGIASVDVVPAVSPKATGGDIIVNDGEYWYHAFLTTGAFKPKNQLSCEYLVVAGGGGGRGDFNSGGGAGGYRTSIGGTPLSLTPQIYPVTVGAGGTLDGGSGSDSIFASITSTGGGGGNATSGGSGSGAYGGFGPEVYTGGLGNTPSKSPSQGNNGGTATGASGSYKVSGGGGGASAVGGNGTASPRAGGSGGAGSNTASTWAFVTGTGAGGYFAGGGGAGGSSNYGVTAGSGGIGGGGAGNATGLGTAGTANTGGGGGGSSEPGSSGSSTNGGAGGSGIVIVRYAMA